MNKLIRDYDSRLVRSEEIASGIWHMTLECPEIAKDAKAGNFVLLSPSRSTAPFLRRPLGILRVNRELGTIEILYRIVGSGTRLISEFVVGERLSIRGPVGSSFGNFAHEKVIAVAGTLGVVPLLFLRDTIGKFDKMFLGVGNADWKGFAEWVKTRAPEMDLYSDDGSIGKKGVSILGLEGLDLSDSSIVCCGPNPMMKAAYEKYGSVCDDMQVSLEKRMACGMGGCYGCVVNTVNGKRRICVDGPVFQAKEVDWNALHL